MPINEEHDKELKKVVHEKMEQLSLAHYSGDIKCFLAITINKAGDTNIFQGFDSNSLSKLYLACGIMQRKMESQILSGEKPLKEME